MENYLNLRNSNDDSKLKEIGNIIKNGGIVVFPTETVYGIGTNALNENSIKRLYKIKKRPLNKPISLLVSNMDMVNQIANDISKKEYELMKRFFPGPFTIILKKKDIVPNILTANTDTVGVRMPDNEIAKKLIEYAGVPIATSSANISGKESETNLKNIIEIFNNKVDYFIDGGESNLGIPSTIVKVIDDIPYILRKGSITEEQLFKS